MAMLDILQFSGQSTDVLNDKWVFITTKYDNVVIQPRAVPQHARLSDESTMIINGGFTRGGIKLSDQTIVFNANTFTWKAAPNYEDSGFVRQM